MIQKISQPPRHTLSPFFPPLSLCPSFSRRMPFHRRITHGQVRSVWRICILQRFRTVFLAKSVALHVNVLYLHMYVYVRVPHTRAPAILRKCFSPVARLSFQRINRSLLIKRTLNAFPEKRRPCNFIRHPRIITRARARAREAELYVQFRLLSIRAPVASFLRWLAQREREIKKCAFFQRKTKREVPTGL